MSDDRQLIAVVGATGAQGGSVVRALVDAGTFRVRALTRNPDRYSGPADEVVEADLNRPDTLAGAFAGAYGVFVVTNFWEPGNDEVAQGAAAVEAAKAAGVRHFVWSTLPDVETISAGKFEVAHFTSKGRVDALVRAAGFDYATFVEMPFYFENLTGVMAPQPLPDGRVGWALPLPGDARVVHMGTVEDLGGLVAAAFDQPERVGAGAYLSAATLMSFDDVISTLDGQGHDLALAYVPGEVFATFFPGAEEMVQMMNYWQAYTYLGPDGDTATGLAAELTGGQVTDFATWAAAHMPVGG